jgi:hypothetical protein
MMNKNHRIWKLYLGLIAACMIFTSNAGAKRFVKPRTSIEKRFIKKKAVPKNKSRHIGLTNFAKKLVNKPELKKLAQRMKKNSVAGIRILEVSGPVNFITGTKYYLVFTPQGFKVQQSDTHRSMGYKESPNGRVQETGSEKRVIQKLITLKPEHFNLSEKVNFDRNYKKDVASLDKKHNEGRGERIRGKKREKMLDKANPITQAEIGREIAGLLKSIEKSKKFPQAQTFFENRLEVTP